MEAIFKIYSAEGLIHIVILVKVKVISITACDTQAVAEAPRAPRHKDPKAQNLQSKDEGTPRHKDPKAQNVQSKDEI